MEGKGFCTGTTGEVECGVLKTFWRTPGAHLELSLAHLGSMGSQRDEALCG